MKVYEYTAKSQLFIVLSVADTVFFAGRALLIDHKVSTVLYVSTVVTACLLGIVGYYLAQTCKRLASSQ